MPTMSRGSPTPWGPVQSNVVLSEGIESVKTGGHGGVWVHPTHPERAHLPIQRREQLWFEEDAEAALVLLFMPSALGWHMRSNAHRDPVQVLLMLKGWVQRWFPEFSWLADQVAYQPAATV